MKTARAASLEFVIRRLRAGRRVDCRSDFSPVLGHDQRALACRRTASDARYRSAAFQKSATIVPQRQTLQLSIV